MSVVPLAKGRLETFLNARDGIPDINPLGPSSPQRHVIPDALGGASSSSGSPLGPKYGKAGLNTFKLPLNQTMNNPRHVNLNGNGVMGPPGTPPIKPTLFDDRQGWDSAPTGAGLLRTHFHGDENEKGLRERWEEQSNMPSIFSESEPTPLEPRHRDLDDNSDTQSDILQNRARPHIGRGHRKDSESVPYIGRNRMQHRMPSSSPAVGVRNGQLEVTHTLNDRKDFSASMITHAPQVGAPEKSEFRKDPFGSTTSEQTSPQPERNAAFLHSSFPYRPGDVAKNLTRVDRASYHAKAARHLAPEKHDDLRTSHYPHVSAQQDRVQSISDNHPPIFSGVDEPISPDSDDDSDLEEINHHEFNLKPAKAAPKTRKLPDNATVVFNPVDPQKSQKSVTLKEEALQISPMSRFIESKKRRRSIDYDETALNKMSFADLQSEPFDHDPKREVPESPAKPPGDNLDDRMKFYSDKSEEAQAQFFTDMSVQDWEESGDWFLERFGDIVRKMKEARQAKRKLVQHYETEIFNREEEVRRKKDSIERKMSCLSRDGSAMLQGKELDD